MSRICELTCISCGRIFYAHSTTALRCNECKQEKARRQHRAYMARRKGAKSLNEIMRDLEAYNREHKTHLTYGQYVSIIEGDRKCTKK